MINITKENLIRTKLLFILFIGFQNLISCRYKYGSEDIVNQVSECAKRDDMDCLKFISTDSALISLTYYFGDLKIYESRKEAFRFLRKIEKCNNVYYIGDSVMVVYSGRKNGHNSISTFNFKKIDDKWHFDEIRLGK